MSQVSDINGELPVDCGTGSVQKAVVPTAKQKAELADPAQVAILAKERYKREAIDFCNELETLLNTDSILRRAIMNNAHVGQNHLNIEFWKFDEYLPKIEIVTEDSFFWIVKYKSTRIVSHPLHFQLNQAKFNDIWKGILETELTNKFPTAGKSKYRITMSKNVYNRDLFCIDF